MLRQAVRQVALSRGALAAYAAQPHCSLFDISLLQQNVGNGTTAELSVVSWTKCRSFASQSQAPPPAHEALAVSPGFIAEPYHPPAPVPWTWPFTSEGRSLRWNSGKNWLSRGLALAWCRNYIPGWKYGDFKGHVIDLYRQISEAYAAGDLVGLEKVTTPNQFAQMRQEITRRKTAGWHRVDFNIEELPQPVKMHFVHGRFVQLSPSSSVVFVQLTTKVPSKQRFAAYDKSGNLVAGNPDEVAEVEDYWVWERKTLRLKGQSATDLPGSRWRLAQRLQIEA